MSVEGALRSRDHGMRRMKRIHGLCGMVGAGLVVLAFGLVLTGCYRTKLGDPAQPAIMHRPPPLQFHRGSLAALPHYNPPMDCRAVASPTGPADYVFYPEGGWSWAVPWIAGLYALACEVDPGITPEKFWAEALATGRIIRLNHDGQEVTLGTVADPVALMARLHAERTRRRPD